MGKIIRCELVEKKQLLPDVIRFTLTSGELAGEAKPGQFMEIKCSDGIDTILRRPVSIADVNRENGTTEIIFQVRGEATRLLSQKNEGEIIDIIGPLGKGFTINEKIKKAAVIGGGIGIFPLLYLSKELKGASVNTYLGFRTKKLIILEDKFKDYSNTLSIAADDGSYGYNGLVTDLLEKDIKNEGFDMIYACGPAPMLKKVKSIAETAGIPCEISVEERMACGVGACLGCAVMVKDGDDWKFGHVCKDGPVFNINEIILD